MTARSTMQPLDIVRLRQKRELFFTSRDHSLEVLAADTSVDALAATIRSLRSQMGPILTLLPDDRFLSRDGRSDAETEAEREWTAGEIIDHVRGAQRFVMGRFIASVSKDPCTAGVRAEAPPPPRTLSRQESLAAIHAADVDLIALLDQSVAIDPMNTIESDWLRTLSIKGILLFFAIHEHDHLEQLRALA